MASYNELVWQISGQQGEGINAAGDILASVLNQTGYYLYGYREFASRIKGGHTHYRLRISKVSVGAISHKLHLLIAMDQKALDVQEHYLVPDSIVLADNNLNAENTKMRHNVIKAPMTTLALEQGNKIVKNLVCLGMSIAIMDLQLPLFEENIYRRFQRKGPAAVETNLNALKAGHNWALENDLAGKLSLNEGDGKQRLFLLGNQAAAMGAIMAGCRFLPAYPITPATEIMEYMSKYLPELGGAVVQTEDEIAAITMAIGAGYAGARAMTATSGPGLSLMTEAIGLSGMTEVPVVVIDAQRGGPSTGLPTKHEQSDLLSAIFGTHGEIPKIVMTPTSVSYCFYQTIRAFNLAEKYQCPVIVLTDVALSLGKQSVDLFNLEDVKVERGKLLFDMGEYQDEGVLFQRYAFTPSGVSARSVPGTPEGVHQVTGLEHDETGLPSEDRALRTAMMDKRLSKIPDLLPGSTHYYGPANPDYLLIGYGSTYGPIAEACSMLTKDGVSVGHLQLLIVWPFPIAEMDLNMDSAKGIFIIENNATGQLLRLLNMFSPYDRKTKSIRKYNGRPFVPIEIYLKIYDSIKGEL